MANEESISLSLEGEVLPPVTSALTLDPAGDSVREIAVTSEVLDMSSLTPAEQQQVMEFAGKIDVTNANQILQYGAGAQRKIAGFSESALSNVRTKDLGETGDMISNLVMELRGFEIDEKDKSFFGIFRKGANRLQLLKTKFDKAEANVDKIVQTLERHQIQLMKDVAMLDEMYNTNLVYLKELAMYILAGKKALQEAREVTLQEFITKAKTSGLPEDAQNANDFANLCDRFEKKIHDLELTRVVSIQMAPQIRLVQNNDTLMAEKIQSSLVNTIPLWKSQMVLAMGLVHSQRAMEAQREVTDMTNELLRKNADMLKTGTIETAKESERGIVDIETLQHTNLRLIETLDEVLKIQSDGRNRRQQAEVELGKIEGQLKQKLLEINQ
ncbi:MAG: toxic anion resistance protein [Clostridiales bacterium]|nr:toxic anion resistance protein [Clostridiales bacterium]